MTEIDRRAFITSSAGLALALAWPAGALAAGDDTLQIAIGAESGNLDLLQNVSSLSSYTIVFESLIGYGKGGVLEPALAESWTVAPDQLSITFNLRKGVTFTDGTPFDATSAEWNLKRWLGKGDFSWIGLSDAFDSIAIDDPHKITIKLKRPVPAGLLELTIVRPVRFLSPKAVDDKGALLAAMPHPPPSLLRLRAGGRLLPSGEGDGAARPVLIPNTWNPDAAVPHSNPKQGAGPPSAAKFGSKKRHPAAPPAFFRSLRRHVTCGLLHAPESHPGRTTAAAGPWVCGTLAPVTALSQQIETPSSASP